MSVIHSELNSASQYFNENWKKYQETIKRNTLYHHEMLSALNTILDAINKPFSFIDIGCGDSSTIIPALSQRSLHHYIGIDAAGDVLKLAEKNFHSIKCRKEFICDNMINAIATLPIQPDIIFASYAVHHLSSQEKYDFIKNCQNHLNQNGYLILVDGVLKPNQNRDEWLNELENRINTTQELTAEELKDRMKHPCADDFPEEIATFQKIAKEQDWKNFEVLFEKDIFAFMVFMK